MGELKSSLRQTMPSVHAQWQTVCHFVNCVNRNSRANSQNPVTPIQRHLGLRMTMEKIIGFVMISSL
jgi:hypothetical protein